MALIRKNPNATFEQPAAAAATAQVPAETVAQPAQPAVAAVAAAAATPAVAQPTAAAQAPAEEAPKSALVRQAGGAVAVNRPKVAPVLAELKDAIQVDWDTFPRLKAGPGCIMSEEGSLGEEIEMTLVSWQNSWDVSPGSDTAEAKKHVAYSDDGVTIKGTGMAVSEYLKELREQHGYKEAKTTQKCILVGILDAAGKQSKHLNSTVQLQLSNQGMKTFDRYRYDRTIKAQMGKQAAEGAERINVKAHLRKNGEKDWTLLEVSAATAA